MLYDGTIQIEAESSETLNRYKETVRRGKSNRIYLTGVRDQVRFIKCLRGTYGRYGQKGYDERTKSLEREKPQDDEGALLEGCSSQFSCCISCGKLQWNFYGDPVV